MKEHEEHCVCELKVSAELQEGSIGGKGEATITSAKKSARKTCLIASRTGTIRTKRRQAPEEGRRARSRRKNGDGESYETST